MSACNIFVLADRVIMLTDSSVYDDNGTVLGFMPKALPVASWNGALSSRGNLMGWKLAFELAEAHASFDEFVARSAAEIERAYRGMVARGELASLQHRIELHAVGWSERDDAPRAFTLDSSVENGRPAYVWRPLKSWITGPDLGAAGWWRLHREGCELDVDVPLAAFDPATHGLAIMEQQRRQKSDPSVWDLPPFHCVGGEAHCTVVTRTGTVQTVLREWNDVPGQPIVPAPDRADLPLIAPSFVPAKDAAKWLLLWRKGMVHPKTLVPPNRAQLVPMPARGTAAPAPMNRKQRRAMAARG